MYSRNQSAQGGQITVPENYDGVAFTEKPPEPQPSDMGERSIKVIGSVPQDVKMSPQGFTKEDAMATETFKESSAEQAGLFSGLLGKIPTFGNLLNAGKIFSGKGNYKDIIKMPKIGKEELLLIGIALFLFFSKDGDKECAIMLALLIFVGV